MRGCSSLAIAARRYSFKIKVDIAIDAIRITAQAWYYARVEKKELPPLLLHVIKISLLHNEVRIPIRPVPVFAVSSDNDGACPGMASNIFLGVYAESCASRAA